MFEFYLYIFLPHSKGNASNLIGTPCKVCSESVVSNCGPFSVHKYQIDFCGSTKKHQSGIAEHTCRLSLHMITEGVAADFARGVLEEVSKLARSMSISNTLVWGQIHEVFLRQDVC